MTAATPFFSVVIPTKNRSYRVGYAIQSVLNQTFPDFEVIVIDNDDTSATRTVVEAFNDKRIRYVRTGNLSMPANWDAGREQAQGEYLKFLPDRQLLKRDALEKIYNIVEKDKHPVLAWHTDAIDDSDPETVFFKINHKNLSGQLQIFDAKVLLERFLNESRFQIWNYLPRGINSVCHKSLIQNIVNGPAGKLCLPATPDFTMAYLQLGYADSVVYLDEALMISCQGDSTGREFRLKRGASQAAFTRDIGEERLYDKVPVKSRTTQNILYNDYMTVRELIPDKLDDYPLPLVNYFVLTYADIRFYEVVGVKTHDDLAQWEQALKQQPEAIQNAVKRRINPYQLRYLATLGNRIDYVWLQKLKYFMLKIKGPRFNNVLDALVWQEQQTHR